MAGLIFLPTLFMLLFGAYYLVAAFLFMISDTKKTFKEYLREF